MAIYRIPRGESITGRSKCPKCRKQIAWFDLVPVISFFILKSRCRQCRNHITWLYPAVEVYSGIIFLLSFLNVGQTGIANWAFQVFILEIFLILAIVDFKNFILPDSVMMVLFFGIVAYSILEYFLKWGGFNIFSINHFSGAVVLFFTLFLFWFFSKGVWLGLGDAKLGGLVGLIFGSWGGLVIFYGSVIIGTIIGLVLLVSHRADLKTRLPLGTFIGFSATLYVFVGQAVLKTLKPLFFSVPFILK